VGAGNSVSGLARGPDGGRDRAVGRAPPEHEHPRGPRRVVDLEVGHGHSVDLGLAQPRHPVVVVGVVGDVAGDIGLLDAADPVLQPRRAGNRPRTGQRLGVALVGVENPVPLCVNPIGLGGELHLERGQRGDLGHQPRLRAIGEVAVGEHEDGRPIGRRDPDRLHRRVEAVARGLRRDDRHRRLAVAPEHRLQQVGLLGLGGQPGRGPAALHVDDDERQLQGDCQPDRLGLERDTGTRSRRDPKCPTETRAQRHADAGDLVLGLHRRHAVALEGRERVQDVGGRGDRIRPEHQRQAGPVRGGDQPERQRGIAGDVAVGARRHRSRPHGIRGNELLGGLAVGHAGGERLEVGGEDLRL